jgi:hypothetical protein
MRTIMLVVTGAFLRSPECVFMSGFAACCHRRNVAARRRQTAAAAETLWEGTGE